MKRSEKIAEAQVILKALGLPKSQQNHISALTLLALCGLSVNDAWSLAERDRRSVTKGIMDFIREKYRISYAPNTRETVRRQVLHQLVLAGVANYNPFEQGLATNSPRAHYAISEAALDAIKTFGTPAWGSSVGKFLSDRTALIEVFERRRSKRLIPVRFADGKSVKLSPGSHNKLQKAVVEQFAPRFAGESNLLYLGDTAKKDLYINAQVLETSGFPITEHDKLPDVIMACTPISRQL